jgi:hypothetical protein
MSAEARLAQLGITLPNPPAPMANYVPWRIGGGLLFLSGVGPRREDGSSIIGTLGDDLTVEQGYEARSSAGLTCWPICAVRWARSTGWIRC